MKDLIKKNIKIECNEFFLETLNSNKISDRYLHWLNDPELNRFSQRAGENFSIDDILVHDMYDKNLAMLLSEITYTPTLPVPFGIIYKENKPTYEQMMKEQIELSIKSKGEGDLNKLILGPNSWEVK